MGIKKVFAGFLLQILLGSLSACSHDNKAIKTNDFLDENIYGNNSIRGLLRFTKDQEITSAGRFMDEKGVMNISLVYKTAKNIGQRELEEKINMVNNKGGIQIRNAEYSLAELHSAYKILVENMKNLGEKGLISIGIDEKYNRIRVSVEKLNEDIKNEIAKLVDMKLVILEEGLPVAFT